MKKLKEVDYHAWHGKPQPDYRMMGKTIGIIY
jgi:hypothetical protein